MKINETHTRTIAKGITWRVIASLSTVMLVFIYTGDLTITLQVGALDTAIKILLYHFHERAWNVSDWGMDVHSPVLKTAPFREE